jgi:Tfp pilus assembly protein PilO
MSSAEKPEGLAAMLLDRLHHPLRLRAFVAAVVLISGYAGVYLPLESSIADTTLKLTQEQKRLALAQDIERLQAQEKRFEGLLPESIDRNEWVEYVLSGIRGFPLKMVAFDAKGSQEIGPFKVIVLNCELEGSFQDMDQLVRWFEFNSRIFRIDSIKIAQHRSNNGLLVMQLVILGLMG